VDGPLLEAKRRGRRSPRAREDCRVLTEGRVEGEMLEMQDTDPGQMRLVLGNHSAEGAWGGGGTSYGEEHKE